MRRVSQHHVAGSWPEANACATITLAYDDRHRRRFRLTDDSGEPFLLDLPTATRMEDGDGLLLENGEFIRVQAAQEDVLDVRCGGVAETARVAWHIGNRHIPLQVLPDGRLRVRADHVLERMLKGLGAKFSGRRDKFSPQPGAYSEQEGQGHHHEVRQHLH